MNIFDFEEVEYNDIFLCTNRTEIETFMHSFTEMGYGVEWKEREDSFWIKVKRGDQIYPFTFEKKGTLYQLKKENYITRDFDFATIVLDFIHKQKGKGILKLLISNRYLIHSIEKGEIVKIIRIHESKKEVVFEKEKTIEEDYVGLLKAEPIEQKRMRIKQEIDWYLEDLLEALQKEDKEWEKEIKEKLEQLRKELSDLES